MLKKFLITMGISAGVFVISVLLHNAIHAWFGVEEPFFFIMAAFLAPAAIFVSAIGSITIALRNYRAKN